MRRIGQSNFVCGLRLALSMLTVTPVRVHRVDRRVAGVAMALAPAVGVLLGIVIGGVGVATVGMGSKALLAAVLTVALAALLTRGLHLDGLADTVDALGSYRGRDAALEIMKRSDIGPFGVVAIMLALLIQTAAVTAILSRPPLAAVTSLAVAAGTGRAAAALACRQGIPAARDTGMGALVSGSVATATVTVAAAGLALLAVSTVPTRPWQGPLAVLTTLGISLVLVRHVVRRLGGITGDVLGATIEITVVLTLIGLALGP